NTLADVFSDPQVLACNLVQSVEHPIVGTLRQVGLPLEMGSIKDGISVRMAPPVFGQHTREVLADFGLDAADIASLEEKRVAFQADGFGDTRKPAADAQEKQS